MGDFDTSELALLVSDLGKAPTVVTKAVMDAMDESGEEFRKSWVANATATAGQHGKHYPKAITASATGGFGTFGVEVGPESGRPQGGMGRGFEYGSINQPPHLDGNRAVNEEIAPTARRISEATAKVLGDLL